MIYFKIHCAEYTGTFGINLSAVNSLIFFPLFLRTVNAGEIRFMKNFSILKFVKNGSVASNKAVAYNLLKNSNLKQASFFKKQRLLPYFFLEN